jgi:hypothetical protein
LNPGEARISYDKLEATLAKIEDFQGYLQVGLVEKIAEPCNLKTKLLIRDVAVETQPVLACPFISLLETRPIACPQRGVRDLSAPLAN